MKPGSSGLVLTAVERDEHYFLMRAEEEAAKAARTMNKAARECHLRMAKVYRQSAISGQMSSIGDCQPDNPEAIS